VVEKEVDVAVTIETANEIRRDVHVDLTTQTERVQTVEK